MPLRALDLNESGGRKLTQVKLEGLSILGYARAKPAGKPTPALNPATGDKLEPGYFWSAREDVERAARLAEDAFVHYGRWPAKERAALLRRIAELFEASAPAIIERTQQETALAPARLNGEMGRTCMQLRLFASLIEEGWWLGARIDHGDAERKPAPKPDVRSMCVPLGPVAVFSSSNFPFAFSVAGGDTASALAAGCPVIVKPHQGHLGASEMAALVVLEAARECGAPEGVFSLLYGPGRDVGAALIQHPLVKAAGFTGSRSGGRALMNLAAARPEPIPVYAEMGSVNPVFFLPGALGRSAEALATGLHASVTLGVGQFCTNPGLVFVEGGGSAEKFLEKLTDLMRATPPNAMLSPRICAEYWAGVEKISRMTGVRRAAEGAPDSRQAVALARPVLFVTQADTFLANPMLAQEVFGPSTLVVECASRSQMLAVAQKLEGQLTATVHGSEDELVANAGLLAILQGKAGRLVCNGFPTGVEVCHAMIHGGPYPATADGRSTSVGTRAIDRFVRPMCYQNFPEAALPDELKTSNPLGLWRLVDGKFGQH